MPKPKAKFARIISAFAGVALAVTLAFSLAGCSGGSKKSEPEGGSLVVAVQKTQNAPDYSGSFAQDFIAQAQKSRASFNLVVIDGSPFVALDSGSVVLGSEKNNADNAAKENAAQLQSATALISGLQGKTNEVDGIKALELADRLHSAAGGNGTTVIASTGLFTTGILDLSGEGMLGIDATTVSNYLKANGYSLENTRSVIWFGLGDVADEQEELTPAIKNSLMNMYEGVLKDLGVENVEFRDDVVATVQEESTVRPSTKLIDVPDVESVVASVAEEVEVGSETKLDSQMLPFVAGTAELVDEEAAALVVKPFADELASNPSCKVTVAGSTASYPWDEESAYRLGEDRARTVAALLEGAGVDKSRIEIKSYGPDAPGHVEDIDSKTGMQIPEKAQLNRWVSITIS